MTTPDSSFKASDARTLRAPDPSCYLVIRWTINSRTIRETVNSIGITSFLRAVAPRGGWGRREFGRCAIERVSLTRPVYRALGRDRPNAREDLRHLRQAVTIRAWTVASYPWTR